MKKLTVLIILTIGFAQDFTVDGDLNVSGNKVLNVADPTAGTDAVNLRSLNELGNMKPERIYELQFGQMSPWLEYTVPSDKLWYIVLTSSGGQIRFYNNGQELSTLSNAGNSSPSGLFVFPGIVVRIYNYTGGHILEYSFTNSGTSQGLNYIEP